MPPPIFSPNDLKKIDKLRGQEVKLQDQVVATEVKLADSQTKLELLVRSGASDTKIDKIKAAIDKLNDGRDALRDRINDVRDTIDSIHEHLLDPSVEVFIPNFRADTPILMLPVRLETRYFDSNQELRIRIFPDQAHIDNHIVQLTADEIAAGRFYWETRWNAANAEGEENAGKAAFAELSRRFRPRRAAWIAFAMTPLNLAAPPRQDAPVFPDPAQRDAAWSRAAYATLLPQRWLATGFVDLGRGQLVKLFQKSTGTSPDRINTGLDPQAQTTPPVDADGVATQLPIDDGIKWIADFGAAEAAGMALRVVGADLDPAMRAAGRNLANARIARLVVHGVNPTLTTEAAAERLNNLLAAHVFADGFELLVPGTPTNNSDAAASGLDSSDDAAIAAIDPLRPLAEGPALASLGRALGVDVAAAHIDRVPGGEMADGVTAGHMINVLWSATLGQTLDQHFDPAMSDADIAKLRQHAVANLRPGGPLPAIRIGHQPYGILPVMASTGFKPADKVEEKLASVIGAVRGIWTRASLQTPTIRFQGKSLAENMEALLQQGPMAANNSFRRVYAAANAKNTNIDPQLSAFQENTRNWVFGAMGLSARMRITSMTAETRQHRLGAPFVQAKLTDGTAPLQPNYLADMAIEAGKTDGRSALVKRGNGSSLLEALASHATVYELDRAASAVVHKSQLEFTGIAVPARMALRIDETIGINAPKLQVTGAAANRQALVQSPADLARLTLPERTGTKTVVNYVIDQLFEPLGRDRDAIASYKSVLDSLDYLAKRPAVELDRLVRGTLDACSYRLDAWIGSLANRRLEFWRAKPASKGISIGGYGWVENLKPDPRPDSEGYVHAPSLQQAQTAAILRSGHLANRDASATALSIDLSSRRVRLALGLLRGIAQGQPMTALLGYRLERLLRDTDILLAKFILPLRRLFPLTPPQGESVLSQQEAVAARDVVDVVKLLDKRRAGGNWLQGISLAPSAAEKAKIEKVVAQIDDMFDAVADLLLAEGVYQLVGGNVERASAALGGIDRQKRPVEPEVIRTPRSGRAFAQRVGILLGEDKPGPDWADFPQDSRAEAEPRLNAWIARLLGEPKSWGFAANLVVPGNGNRPLDPVKLDEIGWSPLSLAILAEPGGNDRPSALQQRLAALFAAQVSEAEHDANAELHLLPDGPAGVPGGLARLEALLTRIRTVIARHRPANALDIAPPGTPAASGVDPAILAKRADKVAADQDAALQGLAAIVPAAEPVAARVKAARAVIETVSLPSAIAGAKAAAEAELANALDLAKPIVTKLLAALKTAASAGARDAIASSDGVVELAELASQVAELLTRAQTRRQTLEADFNDAGASDDDRVEHHVKRLKAMLGEGFPVLAPFALPEAVSKEFTASLADADSLLGKDGAPLHGWMSRMAEVRPRLCDLASCLIASEMTGAGSPDLRVAQFPHKAGARWIGLPLTKESPGHVDLSLVVHAPGFDPASPPKTLAGLMDDDWTETIPSETEATAISFHYDAPAARPPQAMLLAVHPDPAASGWLPSQVLATINEALDLAHIRAVRPQDLDMLGGILPLVYLPENYTQDVPGIDFGKLRHEVMAAIPVHLASVLGKA